MHWPSQLLPNDIDDVRILTFGYDADVVNFWDPASRNKISNHAENLVGALSRDRERAHAEDRKIVFVTHSLGGLVMQNALYLSRESPEAHLRQVEQCTIGICFIGTPHNGSNIAAWASFATKLINVIKPANSDIVGVLKPGSEMLSTIQNSFHGILRKRKDAGSEIDITCFYEELPMPSIGLIVPQSSATIPGYSKYSIHANHKVSEMLQNPRKAPIIHNNDYV